MNSDEAKQLIPQQFVDAIFEKKPPGLSYDTDQVHCYYTQIRCQLAEAVFASTHISKYAIIGERLVQLPTGQIYDLIAAPQLQERREIQAFFKSFQFAGTHIFGTWITLRCYLLAQVDAFLTSKSRVAPKFFPQDVDAS